MPELERRWGNILAARRYRLVVEAIGHVWPEAFAVAPPCCPRVSHDEALLAAMVGAAGAGNRANFDWLTAELLGGDARDMLFVSLGNFLGARAPRRVYTSSWRNRATRFLVGKRTPPFFHFPLSGQ